MIRRQLSFGALDDFSEEIRSGEMTIAEATVICFEMRNKEAKRLREQGCKVVCTSLTNQLNKYWGYGDPCGLSCNCYYITILSEKIEKVRERENWQLVGHLPTGEAVYCSDIGDYAKEMDYEYFVQMTTKELHSVVVKNLGEIVDIVA